MAIICVLMHRIYFFYKVKNLSIDVNLWIVICISMTFCLFLTPLQSHVRSVIQWTLTYLDSSVPKMHMVVRITEFLDKWVTFYIYNHNCSKTCTQISEVSLYTLILVFNVKGQIILIKKGYSYKTKLLNEINTLGNLKILVKITKHKLPKYLCLMALALSIVKV